MVAQRFTDYATNKKQIYDHLLLKLLTKVKLTSRIDGKYMFKVNN